MVYLSLGFISFSFGRRIASVKALVWTPLASTVAMTLSTSRSLCRTRFLRGLERRHGFFLWIRVTRQFSQLVNWHDGPFFCAALHSPKKATHGNGRGPECTKHCDGECGYWFSMQTGYGDAAFSGISQHSRLRPPPMRGQPVPLSRPKSTRVGIESPPSGRR